MFRGVVARYLTPSDRLWEITAGLIMVLTVTSTLKLGLPEREESIGTMILAALGCNLAWGIADGVMYAFTSGLERGRYAKLLSSTQSTGRTDEALQMVEAELESTIIGALEERERRVIAAEVLKGVPKAGADAWVTRDDVIGGFWISILVFVSAFPVVVPFLFVGDLRTVMRVSNTVAIAMLFLVGYGNARYSHRNRLRAGLVMCLPGLVIVAICVALGG